MTQPAKDTECGNNLRMQNEYITTREPSRVSGWKTKGSQFTATIGIESGRNYVELVQMTVKLLPLPQLPARARTDARTNPSAQRATQLRSLLARVYAVSIQNQITTTVP
jgi:hypothetical protein